LFIKEKEGRGRGSTREREREGEEKDQGRWVWERGGEGRKGGEEGMEREGKKSKWKCATAT
jgi:hypothetical protein